MALVDNLLRLGSGYGRQALSRIIPTSKERVLKSLMANADELFSPARAEGATFDPRLGRFLEAGRQQGQMMSPVPNPVDGSNVARNIDDLLRIAQQPQNMNILRRGGYLGSWNSPERGGLVVDPSRRFLTKVGALRQGVQSEQDAGFNLLAGDVYPAGQAAYNQARNRALGVAGTLGGAAVAAEAARGEDSQVQNFLTGLLGQSQAGKVGIAEGIGAATNAALRNPLVLASLGLGAAGGLARVSRGPGFLTNPKGYIRPDVLAGLERAGVKRGAATTQEAVKNNLKKNGFTDEQIASLNLDNATPDEALNIQYNTLGSRSEGMYSEAALRKAPILESLKTRVSNLDDVDVNAANVIAQRAKSTPLRGEELPLPAPSLTGYGVRPVRHVGGGVSSGNLDPTKSLARLTPEQAAESMEDIIHNLDRFIDEDSIAAALTSAPEGWFYPTMYSQRLLMSQLFKEPGFMNAIKSAIASARSAPLKETQKVGKAAEYLRDSTSGPGTKMITDINQAAQQVVDDMVGFLKNPRVLKGAQDKVLNYLATQFGPFQNRTSVVDSWMIRAAFGNPKYKAKIKDPKTGAEKIVDKALDTTNSEIGYGMMDDAIGHLAQKYGTSPKVIQEIIWRNVRLAAGEGTAKTTFAKLDDETFAGAIKAAQDPTNQAVARAFEDSLLAAIEKEPELAKYFTIEGEELMLTDEFMKLLKSIQTKL